MGVIGLSWDVVGGGWFGGGWLAILENYLSFNFFCKICVYYNILQ